MISLDTETTGIDLHHGAKPFFITTCAEDGEQQFWEWDVNPLTREPEIPEEDIDEIAELLSPNETDSIVFQNSKFDITALSTIRPEFGEYWRWEDTHDTLLAGHLLASNQPHDLTTMVMIYLRINIKPYEDALEHAVKDARKIVKDNPLKFKGWYLCKTDDPSMPSVKGKTWGYDSWLPRAVAKRLKYSSDHPWYTVLRDYSNVDSEVTLALFKKQRELIKKRGLWEIYLERLKVLPVAYKMEQRGITLSAQRLKTLEHTYSVESAKAEAVCLDIAKELNCELSLPKSGNNGSLHSFVFDSLKLPVVKRSEKTGKPSLDKEVLSTYQATLPEGSRQLEFIDNLTAKRKRDTALSYLDGYQRFWIPILNGVNQKVIEARPKWYVLHPNLNPTGTDTLRWSSNYPNEQNISKKEGFNLRHCFGPAPGRVWYSLDAQNIELRIPAFEAPEPEMVHLFNNPDKPPYFGSYHMLIFDTLHPDKFKQYGMKCKEVYESTWYQWTKNGNFAVQYGAQEYSGTADRAYHVRGAQRRIQSRFRQIELLSKKWLEFANKHGYVETIPDKTVNPKRGYPLLCTRSDYGKVLPTVPLSYHVQSTAMWWMAKAMTRCQNYLDELNAKDQRGYYLIMQIHDEMVFDFPNDVVGNRPKILKIKQLMEQGGNDLGLPTPVSCEIHTVSWDKGAPV